MQTRRRQGYHLPRRVPLATDQACPMPLLAHLGALPRGGRFQFTMSVNLR